MLSLLARRHKGVRSRSTIAAIRYLALVGLLSACATDAPRQPPIATAASGDGQNSTECSFAGRLACRAMALVSGHGSDSEQGSCTASRSGATHVETCGTVGATVAAPAQPPTKAQTVTDNFGTASRSSVQLAWQDNSNNETGFIIERCDPVFKDLGNPKLTVNCSGAWKIVGSAAANTTTYVDDTVTANQTYIYRVRATNQSGSSASTAEAVITAPVK